VRRAAPAEFLRRCRSSVPPGANFVFYISLNSPLTFHFRRLLFRNLEGGKNARDRRSPLVQPGLFPGHVGGRRFGARHSFSGARGIYRSF
jgi:hypothetical protein